MYSSTFVNDDLNHKYNDSLIFKIENETDLHVKVVSFLRKRFSHSLFTATLGENQDNVNKWIDSFCKGYLKRSPDLIIHNLHKRYAGFASNSLHQRDMVNYHAIRKRCCYSIKEMDSK